MGLTVHWDLEFKGTDQEAFEKLQALRTLAEKLPLEKIEGPAELDYDDFTKAYRTGKRYGGLEALGLYPRGILRWQEDREGILPVHMAGRRL